MSYLIAVATSDAKVVDLGFGAAKGFHIYEVEGTEYKEKEYRELESIDKTPVDISKVPDEVYEGYSETTLVKVRVKVSVSDGSIENIELLEHECGKGKPAEVIIADMTDGNTTEVDAVTGATVSSEVIKAAVRNALRSE